MKFKILLFLFGLFSYVTYSQENGIVNNLESEYVKFKSIDIGDCKWTEGFWADKFKAAETNMVPYMEKVLTGDVGHALNNFKVAAGLKEGKHKGMHWHDGDFYKWIEAATYIYAINKDEALLKRLEDYIAIIAKAQQPNGFLQTQITIRGLEPFSERKYHEMYNSGHLYVAASIYYRVTGKRSFLDIAVKHADNLYETFKPRPEHLKRFGFNQVQIMGLVELYRTTKDKRYLELAEIFVNMRGQSKVVPHPTVRHNHIGDMTQERTPLRKEDEAVGHAVLGLYMWAGAADIYAETGEKAIIEALDRIWGNIVDKKMYITGACGQAHDGGSSNRDFVHEAFTIDYQMPNASAYNETCANLCNAMFNYRLLGVHGESKYADVIETVMFNSGISGIDLAGENYFYTNPLRRTYDQKIERTNYPNRVPYIPCFCCPPNLVRTVSKLSGWAYSLTAHGVAVNLYGGNTLNTKMLDGSKLKLRQETQYPWEGMVKLTIEEAKKEPFEVLLRIPEWAQGATVSVNEKEANTKVKSGMYVVLKRAWKKDDVIQINMPLEVKLFEGHPRIEEVRNQVAVKRGPIVYCTETPDLPENTSITDVYLPVNSEFSVTHKPNFLGGVTTLNTEMQIRKDKGLGMYRELDKAQWENRNIQLIPYFTWSNRGLAEMSVWLPLIWGE